jgi:ABC-type nitrate/sulfonate/bicarbonate transport system substrate-binding protein
LANGIPIKIVAYQYDFELRLEALPSIQSVADLKDKKIGVPFGTTAYKLASDVAKRNGMAMSSLINVGAADLGTALNGGQVSAVAIWDPVWGILEKTYKTVPLEKQFYSGFTNMRLAFVESNRSAAVRFLAAQMLAIVFRANNQVEADRRYETAFGISPDVARAAQAIDRSYNWRDVDQVNLELQAKDYDVLTETKSFLVKENLIPKDVDLKSAVDMSLLKEARQLIKSSNISLSQIKYTSTAR